MLIRWLKRKIGITPHIVVFPDNKYAVRKLIIFGWVYASKNMNNIYWWDREDHVNEYCIIDTLNEAIRVQQVYNRFNTVKRF